MLSSQINTYNNFNKGHHYINFDNNVNSLTFLPSGLKVAFELLDRGDNLERMSHHNQNRNLVS